jgi:hypothetical protein
MLCSYFKLEMTVLSPAEQPSQRRYTDQKISVLCCRTLFAQCTARLCTKRTTKAVHTSWSASYEQLLCAHAIDRVPIVREHCPLRYPQLGVTHCRKTPSCYIASHDNTNAATRYSPVEANASTRQHKNLHKMWSLRTTLQICLIIKHLDIAYGYTINRIHTIGEAHPLRRSNSAQASSLWLCKYHQPYVCKIGGLNH